MKKRKAVLFDMDGTILDTAADLRDACNYAMKQTGHCADFTSEDVCLLFGSGVKVAMERALAVEAGYPKSKLLLLGTEEGKTPDQITKEEIDRVVSVYKPYYEEHSRILTCPYEGILDLMHSLRDAGILTAVVSNKPDPAVQELAETYFPECFDYVLGERSGLKRKPSCDMILYVCKQMGIQPSDAIYVGDTEIDLLTSKSAGMDCAAVSWGFRSKQFLIEHGANTVADNCDELKKNLLDE